MPEHRQIRDAFLDACRAELTALKPGNVHIHAPGHDMVVAQFEAAAEAAAPIVADATLSLGVRIRRAVEASMAVAGCNTNLGIVLLCVPLAGAAASRPPGDPRPLRQALAAVLDSLTVADAEEAYRAIALANPGGLGRAAEADVARPASLTLKDAMALAAGRDRIARAYVTGYADVFGLALPLYRRARRVLATRDRAVTALHMGLLAAFPDSHIARKYGASVAEGVRAEAAAIPALTGGPTDEARLELMLAFDMSLKQRGLNPGTTADFVVATLFAQQLEMRPRSAISGR